MARGPLCVSRLKMSVLLLLLGVCFPVGFSYDYGAEYTIRINRRTQVIEFSPDHSSDVIVLWSREKGLVSEEKRHKVTGSYFVIEKVTQSDSGSYRLKDEDQRVLTTKYLGVSENRRHGTRTVGEYYSFTTDLESWSCNIDFFPDNNGKYGIVRQGNLDYYEHECQGFEVIYPCGISNYDLQLSCSGRFEVRDEQGNLAHVETLEMEALPVVFDASYIGIGVGVFLGTLCCCCCVRRCCCKNKSSKNDIAETPGAAYYHEYNSEPVRREPDHPSQPSETLCPTLPSYNPSVPLIHKPPAVTVPPAYSEVSGPAMQSDAPTLPKAPMLTNLSEDREPRFELSIPSAFPLSSDSTFADVYTSDKLNF